MQIVKFLSNYEQYSGLITHEIYCKDLLCNKMWIMNIRFLPLVGMTCIVVKMGMGSGRISRPLPIPIINNELISHFDQREKSVIHTKQVIACLTFTKTDIGFEKRNLSIV